MSALGTCKVYVRPHVQEKLCVHWTPLDLQVVATDRFGDDYDRYDVGGLFPKCSAIIVGWRDVPQGVFKPRVILLKHQLYVRRVEEWRAAGAKDISVAGLVTPWVEVPA